MDPHVRQQVRKIRVAALDEVEDQLWPVNLAIVILAGFVTGLVLAVSRFDEPRILHNAVFQLTTVGLTLAAWFAGVRFLRGKMKQRLKLAVLFSLLVHLWMLMGLGVGYYKLVAQGDEGRRAVEEIAAMTVPEYAPEQMDRPDAPSEYHRPSETETPQAPVPEAPKQEADRPQPPDKKPADMPEPPKPEQIDPQEIERRELTAPRRAEEAAGQEVSRQEWKERPQPDRPIPLPEVRAAQAKPAPAPKTDPLDRQRLESPQAQRRAVDDRPEAAKPQEVIRPNRRGAQPEPQPDKIATPAPAERMLRAAEVARTEAKAPEPVRAAEEPRPAQLEPRQFAVNQQREAPVASKQSQEPEPQAAVAPMRAPSPQRQMDWRPEVARTPDRTPARQPRRAEMGAAVAEPQPEAAVAAEVRTVLAPSSQAQQDRRDPALGPASGRRAEVEALSAAPGAGIAASLPQRTERPAAPSLQFQAGPPDRVAARASLSPSPDMGQIDQPASAQPAAAGGANPASRVESQASQQTYRSAGLPGNLRSQAQAGAVTPVTGAGSPLPAAAARRPQASREGADGMRLPTDALGMLPRARPGSNLPSAAEPAEEASLAGSGGLAVNSGGAASRPEAGSNTAVARQAPGAPVGRGGSAPGAAEFTASPGPVGAMSGKARPSGFGVPALAAASTPQIGRADLGAAGMAGLGGTVAQDMPGVLGGGPASAQGPSRSGPEGTATAVTKTGGGGLPGGSPVGMPGLGSLAGGGAIASPNLPRAGGGGDRAPGAVVEGGVPGAVRRAGRMPSADLAGDVPEAVGTAPSDGGRSTAGPSGVFDPGAAGLKREPGGLPGPLAIRTPVEGAAEAGLAAATPGASAGLRRVPQGDRQGPSLAADVGGGPLGRSNLPGLPSGTAEMVGAGVGPVAGVQGVTEAAMSGGLGAGEVGRQGGGLPVRIAAMPGAGGLSLDPSPAVGIPSRRARPESEVVQTSGGRFLLERTGGQLAIDARAVPAEAFRQRDPGKRREEAMKRGGSEESERAVEMGLDFLARSQFPDGHWSVHSAPERFEAFSGEKTGDPARLAAAAKSLLKEGAGGGRRPAIERLVGKHDSGRALSGGERQELAGLVRTATLSPGFMQADAAATGLALLSFLGAGYTHQDGKHRDAVLRGLEWLVANQKPDGDLFGRAGGSKYTWYYSHGIAAIALCEAYGMTRDPRLKEPAERAILFIAASQHPTRGGWRYTPREEADTSVSGWQLMAMKSAQMAGLAVPKETLEKVSRWLDLAQGSGGDATRYAYNPFAEDTPEQRHGRRPTLSMTAEALLMRMYQGWNRENSSLARGADWLKENLPEVGTLDRPTRDVYYWYYATQVMYQMGGAHWEAWNGRLRPLLEQSQVQQGPLAGSWHPDRPVPDRWGPDAGRHYVTTMHLLMLEVYYRHLPLFKTLRDDE